MERAIEKLSWSSSAPVSAYVKTVFELDLRSLAVFRMVLGALILIDTILRASDLTLHYTDAGLIPVSALTFPESLSLFALSGSFLYTAILFGVMALLAMAFMVGYRFRIVAPLLWIFIISLQNRNVTVLDGFDIYVRFLVLWSVFLPLGALWSVDARRSAPANVKVSSIATFAILFQIIVVYTLNGWNKLNHFWLTGDAIQMIFHYWAYVKPLGRFLLEYPLLLKAATYGTLLVELIFPIFLLIPFQRDRFRLLFAVPIALLHIGIAFCLGVGLYSYLAMAVMLLFIPGAFWDFVDRKARVGTPTTPTLSPAGVLLCSILCFLVHFRNATVVMGVRRENGPFTQINRVFKLQQNWTMFKVPQKTLTWATFWGIREEKAYLLPENIPLEKVTLPQLKFGYRSHRQKKFLLEFAPHRELKWKYRESILNYFCRMTIPKIDRVIVAEASETIPLSEKFRVNCL